MMTVFYCGLASGESVPLALSAALQSLLRDLLYQHPYTTGPPTMPPAQGRPMWAGSSIAQIRGAVAEFPLEVDSDGPRRSRPKSQ
jgi:hypothetical protein